MSTPSYKGIVFIGDPHLFSRILGYRKDDYPRVILDKLAWSLNYAEENNYVPAILGDFFEYPRDNANWLIAELCHILYGRGAIAIYGNHDVRENALRDDDSVSIIFKAGLIELISEQKPWVGEIGGKKVIVGGTSYGEFRPSIFYPGVGLDTLVLWMMHHDIWMPDYQRGHMEALEIPGVHYVINGHIHRRLDECWRGKTCWITPGNISRTRRNEREHAPAILKFTYDGAKPRFDYVTIPHQPFDDVFHAAMTIEPVVELESAFIRGLAELQARRTESGAGLAEFLEENLDQFEPEVVDEIRILAREILEVG